MKKIYAFSLFLLFTLSIGLANEREVPIRLYVSPIGHDYLDGRTPSNPMRSIDRAVREAREIRRIGKENISAGIEIHLASGTYFLDETIFIRPEDSGTSESPTKILGAERGQTVISGGTVVTGWTSLETPVEGLSKEIQKKIWVADAPKSGNRIVETRQLWVNGRKALRASLVSEGQMVRMVDFKKDRREIWIPTPNIKGLEDASRLEMIVHQRWAIAILRVKKMEVMGKVTRVSFHEPESRLEFEHPWPQPVIGESKGNSSFNLANDIRLLDEPGEWYQDYPSGKIYYYPREGETISSIEAIVPVLSTLLDINGSLERGVSHIQFSNLCFQHAAWLQPSLAGHVTLQGGMPLIDAYKLIVPGLPEKAELENQAWIGRPVSALRVKGANHIAFQDCDFAHLGATGLDFEWAVQNCEVRGSLFHDIGGTAIALGAFPSGGFETHVPYKPYHMEELCRKIDICDNMITDVTNEDWGCVGIGAGYVSDVTIARNEVANLNYSGICVGWGWTSLESGMQNNHIVDNYVHHFARQLYDAGGIYTLSNQPSSSIKGNRIEHLTDAPYATNDRGFYIYLDEATDGFTIENNWCPESKFGDNRPGPSIVWGCNGKEVSDEVKNKAGLAKTHDGNRALKTYLALPCNRFLSVMP